MTVCGIPLLDQRHCRVDIATTLGEPICWTVHIDMDVSTWTFDVGLIDAAGFPAEVTPGVSPLTIDDTDAANGNILLCVTGLATTVEPLGLGNWTWWLSALIPPATEPSYVLGGLFSIYPVWVYNPTCVQPQIIEVTTGLTIEATVLIGESYTPSFPSGLVLPKTEGVGIRVDPAAPTFPWFDLMGIFHVDEGGANAATLDNFRNAVRAYRFGVNDKMDVVWHITHDYLPDSDLFIHVHWSHVGTAISGNLALTYESTYAKGHSQANFPASKVITQTIATPNVATIPQYNHRIDEVLLSTPGGSATQQDTSLIEVDGLMLTTVTVTGLPTITGGTTAEVFIHAVDIHYQSTGIGTKQKAPNFYV